MDIDNLDPGEDFADAIEKSVKSCDILVAVIGRSWLDARDPDGKRRLDNPEDFVRLEISNALRRGIRVVPVLVDGAVMPRSTQLPEELQPIVRRQAVEVSHNRFASDSERIIQAINRAFEKAAAEEAEREKVRADAERLEREKQRLEAEQKEKERLETQRHEDEKVQGLETERRRSVERARPANEQQEKARLETEQTASERPDAERRQYKEKLQDIPPSRLPRPISPFAPSTLPAKPEGDKPSAETLKVVYPLPPKPAEREREKPPPPSSGGTGGKSPSKQLIAILAIVAVLVVGGLIYLANRPSQSPPPEPTPASASPSQTVIATPTKQTRTALEAATKDHPWVNSLGMKFVPVAGTEVLFSVWDTRVQDFEAFVADTNYDATEGIFSLGKDGWKQRGATWKEPGFSQGATYPVVGVSWADAKAFCSWLTKKEQAAGRLPPEMVYRLPSDEEWSAAVGLKNEVGSTPEEKSGKLQLYPWDIPQKRDQSWPPPSGAGNYAGKEAKIGDWPSGWPVIEGYNDGYPRTSPVGSFEANFSGLYDMGGDVWQWCEDWYNAQAQDRVLRGASWINGKPDDLLASHRHYNSPVYRNVKVGFRCVVAAESSR